jgi:hypothetical protein
MSTRILMPPLGCACIQSPNRFRTASCVVPYGLLVPGNPIVVVGTVLAPSRKSGLSLLIVLRYSMFFIIFGRSYPLVNVAGANRRALSFFGVHFNDYMLP